VLGIGLVTLVLVLVLGLESLVVASTNFTRALIQIVNHYTVAYLFSTKYVFTDHLLCYHR